MRTKRGTVSQAQIADVMGYGQLGSDVRCLRPRNAESLPAQGPAQTSCAQRHSPSEYVKCLGSDLNSEAPQFGHHRQTGLFHTVSPLSEFVTGLGSSCVL